MADKRTDLARRLAAEVLGTAFLLATVVGSGIMGDTLAGGITGLALLANAVATGAILVVLITVFGPISGAHFNPAVTMAFWLRREIGRGLALAYIVAQIIGGAIGVIAANAMFDLPWVHWSMTERSGGGQWLAEGLATFGLLVTILGCLRARPEVVPYAVGLFITAGYWFTSSTSFANPAVTLARSLSDSFAGIAAADMPIFIFCQLVGALLAVFVMGWFAAEPAIGRARSTARQQS
ncbi:MAG: MIP/aquaporin family protein [Pseudomonadota bacterium]